MPRPICLHKTSQIGYRDTNEDRESYLINLANDGTAENAKYAPIDFFIVCDGHGGSEVSTYIVPKLQKIFTDRRMVYPLDNNFVYGIFHQLQKEIESHPKRIGDECGSTVLIVVRYLDKAKREAVQIFNLGDCRAVLARGALALPLTIDHKPCILDEKLRIDAVNKKMGTNEQVHFDSGDWRIIDLSVSRSMGDVAAKPYVSHIPEIFQYQLQSNDEFIIIGCDGTWDMLSNMDAVNFVRDHIFKNHPEKYNIQGRYPVPNEETGENIARKLAQYAIAKGSTDNVSVLIVFFNRK